MKHIFVYVYPILCHLTLHPTNHHECHHTFLWHKHMWLAWSSSREISNTSTVSWSSHLPSLSPSITTAFQMSLGEAASSQSLRICCFAVVGLITSVISDSFMASQQREQKSKVHMGSRGPGPFVDVSIMTLWPTTELLSLLFCMYFDVYRYVKI